MITITVTVTVTITIIISGLKSIEQTYKETKVKSAIKLLGSTDQIMDIVNQLNRICMNTNHFSIFKDAIKYASEMGFNLELSPSSYNVSFEKENVNIITTSLSTIKN